MAYSVQTAGGVSVSFSNASALCGQRTFRPFCPRVDRLAIFFTTRSEMNGLKNISWQQIRSFDYDALSVQHLYLYCFRSLNCPRSTRSRIYVTVRCPSVCPSVSCARCHSVRRVCCCEPGGQEISIDCCTSGAAAVNAGNATFTAAVGGWTQTLVFLNLQKVFGVCQKTAGL